MKKILHALLRIITFPFVYFAGRESFSPTPLGIFFNQFYLSRRASSLEIKSLAVRFHGKLLDVGCGTKPYEKFFACDEYIGLEVGDPKQNAWKKADVFYQGDKFPFPDNTFDGVVTFQVFEHVKTPDAFLSEVNRVLKKDGLLLMTVPFVWDEHEQPYDFRRYSSFGIKNIIDEHGFEIMSYSKTCADLRVIFLLLNAYIDKKIKISHYGIRCAVMCLLTAPINVLGTVLGYFLPSNEDLFKDNIVLARKSE